MKMVQDTAHAIITAAAPYFEAAAPAVIGYLAGRGSTALYQGTGEGTNAAEQWKGRGATSAGLLGAIIGGSVGLQSLPHGMVAGPVEPWFQALGGLGIGAVVGDGLSRLVRAETVKENVAEKSANAGRMGRAFGATITPTAYLALHYLSQRL